MRTKRAHNVSIPTDKAGHHLRLPRTVFPVSRRRGPQLPFCFPGKNKNATITDNVCPTHVHLLSTHTEKSGRIAPARSRMMGGEKTPCAPNCVGIDRALRMTKVID